MGRLPLYHAYAERLRVLHISYFGRFTNFKNLASPQLKTWFPSAPSPLPLIACRVKRHRIGTTYYLSYVTALVLTEAQF